MVTLVSLIGLASCLGSSDAMEMDGCCFILDCGVCCAIKATREDEGYTWL